MRFQEELSCLFVRGHTLQKGQHIASLVRCLGVKVRRGQLRIDRNYFLKQRGHRAH
jgi:hypothetical protein